jgi:hypothetical protein
MMPRCGNVAPVVNLFLDVSAEAALAVLYDAEPHTAERIDALLDVLAEDPGDQRVRRRVLRAAVAATGGLQGPLFGFTVRGHGHDILVMWQESEGEVDVRYLGPDI